MHHRWECDQFGRNGEEEVLNSSLCIWCRRKQVSEKRVMSQTWKDDTGRNRLEVELKSREENLGPMGI